MTTITEFDAARHTRDGYPGWIRLALAVGLSGFFWLALVLGVAAASGRL